jgi:hypothetical protein
MSQRTDNNSCSCPPETQYEPERGARRLSSQIDTHSPSGRAPQGVQIGSSEASGARGGGTLLPMSESEFDDRVLAGAACQVPLP